MKRYFSVFVFLSAMILLAACSSSDVKDDTDRAVATMSGRYEGTFTVSMEGRTDTTFSGTLKLDNNGIVAEHFPAKIISQAVNDASMSAAVLQSTTTTLSLGFQISGIGKDTFTFWPIPHLQGSTQLAGKKIDYECTYSNDAPLSGMYYLVTQQLIFHCALDHFISSSSQLPMMMRSIRIKFTSTKQTKQ